MAEHTAPSIPVPPRIEFSDDEWSELTRISGVPLNEEIQTKLMERIRRYIEGAVRHHEGAPRKKVEAVLKKIGRASKTIADELLRLSEFCFHSHFGY